MSPTGPRTSPTFRVVVMGVAGSGKTTVGRRLADRLDADFLDADAAHPVENIAKMTAGIPLTDADRWPWLDRLTDALRAHDRIVVTCSSLKRAYRDRLRRAGGVQFVHLEIARAEVLARVQARTDHFMGVGMVESQFHTLEPPGPIERDIVVVDAASPVDEVVARATAALLGDKDG